MREQSSEYRSTSLRYDLKIMDHPVHLVSKIRRCNFWRVARRGEKRKERDKRRRKRRRKVSSPILEYWNGEPAFSEQWWTINYRGGGIVIGCVKCAFEPCAKRQSRNYASKRGAALLNLGWRLVSGRVMIENTLPTGLPSLVDPRNEKRSYVGQVSRHLLTRNIDSTRWNVGWGG